MPRVVLHVNGDTYVFSGTTTSIDNKSALREYQFAEAMGNLGTKNAALCAMVPFMDPLNHRRQGTKVVPISNHLILWLPALYF